MIDIKWLRQDPQAFIWTAKAQDIIKKVNRARRVLDKASLDKASSE